MPALFTHYNIGRDILNKLDKNIQNEINSNIKYYDMYNQGFDNLFYYPIHWKYYKNFAIKAHSKNILEFFTNMINFIKINNLENRSDLTTMVYGFINHYTVDTIIHPFINYQVKYLNIPHSRIEFMLDSRTNNKHKSDIYNTVMPRLKFKKELINLIDYTFDKTYKEKSIGKKFNLSHNNSYYIYRYFINDKLGFKTFCYKIIDFIIPFKELKLHEFTLFFKEFDDRILNNDKILWHHPKNKKETYNYSFNELYNFSLNICLKLNTIAYEVLHNNRNIDDLINLIKIINIKNIQDIIN